MKQFRRALVCLAALSIACALTSPLAAQTARAAQSSTTKMFDYWDDPANWLQQFVPDSHAFWDNSRNWTTNYGPAYRDTIISPAGMLGCSTQFALCFHSGAEPYPCTLSPDGQSANCLCTVSTQTNYTLITAILNRPIYEQTVATCGSDGSGCTAVGQAPVCNYLNNGALIPGATVISTYDPEAKRQLVKAFSSGNAGLKTCDKGLYAGCMTAPCQLNSDGTANCKCPVFDGRFQLVGKDAACSLGGDLVPSASYIPVLDSGKNQ